VQVVASQEGVSSLELIRVVDLKICSFYLYCIIRVSVLGVLSVLKFVLHLTVVSNLLKSSII
jgi:hypothetical protein